MWDLLWEEDSRTTIELSTIKKRFGQKIARELLGLESSFSAVRICVQSADGLFNVFIDIRVVSVFCFKG